MIGGDASLVVAADAPTVWLVDLDNGGVRARGEAVALSPTDLPDAARHADAAERLLRRRLARLLLAAAGGCRADAVAIERDAAGAPIVTAPAGWHVSVAARWPDCAIGVAQCRLGVDLERIDAQQLPGDLLTDSEHRHLIVTPDQGDAASSPARIWAAKEAHAKWTGRPRDLDPAAIDTAAPPLVTSRFGTTRCWLLDRPGHVAAVCTA